MAPNREYPVKAQVKPHVDNLKDPDRRRDPISVQFPVMKRIKDVMTPHAKSISPDTSLVAAALIMRDLNVGSLPVCEDNYVVGIVTDRDLAIRGLAGFHNPESVSVRTIMSDDVACIFAGQDVEEAARIMEMKQVRRLPVLNQENELVGIVSLGDLASFGNLQLMAEALQMISEPSHA